MMLPTDRYNTQNVATEISYLTSGSTAGTVLIDYSNTNDFIPNVNYVNLLQAQVQYKLTSNLSIDDQILAPSLASWPSMFQNKPSARLIEKTPLKQTTLHPITMEEAQHIATNALLAAENRRQNERQQESDFWMSFED